MKASRRSILKLIGLAPAAPLAAKIESDTKIARVAGVSLEGAVGVYGTNLADSRTTQIAASHFAQTFGVPEFVREQLRREAQYVSYLDPDLAAKRSWSMAVKIGEQRQRNLARQIERIGTAGRYAAAAEAFKRATGWDWPW